MYYTFWEERQQRRAQGGASVQYRLIPDTTLEPSVICLGTATMGTSINEDDSMRLLDAFLDRGGTFIDTAYVYGQRGEERQLSEKVIGKWLARRGVRDRVVLATKGASLHPKTGKPRLTPEDIRFDLEASLRALDVETIDLYWLHRDDPDRPVEGILEALERHRAEGKIRYYGCSNWHVDRVQAAAQCARQNGWHGFVANQMRWSLARYNPQAESDPTMVNMDDATHAYHTQSQMAAVPYTPQAAGFFSGRYGRGVEKPDSPRAGGVIRAYYNETNFDRLERATQLGQKLGCSANDVALAYLIHQPFPVFPIVGCRTVEQLDASCASTEVRLSSEELAFLAPDGV